MNTHVNPSRFYEAKRRTRHVQRADFHITELQLLPHQSIPWHLHRETADTFFVLEGSILVTLHAPHETFSVSRGEIRTVECGRPHRVTVASTEPATFLILQGMGRYDFVPVDMPA